MCSSGSKLVSRAILFVVAALASTSVLAICGEGQVAIGYKDNTAVIVANDCGVIDYKDNDADLCYGKAFKSGSKIDCNAGTVTIRSTTWKGFQSATGSCPGLSVAYCVSRLP
ncbi:hypothetical protein PNOK_0602900 [Pyrrhoderma noxium]|uniref:Uncharacterized protein n=1 Tax=Pyrrhoderma noxium TaxID=2282107 RepID=A0A286UIA5_9AGAM|nr:hypothetical protein PNOK_0602900 [Pyrrhoderma noxium]